jgi:hypothetical protein
MADEIILYKETNPAANTRWLQKMSQPPSIKGHALRKERNGYWCACGHYCGGLEAIDEWDASFGGLELSSWARLKHGIHLVRLHHQR